jgi:RNA polymerase sigma-70 factor, ECF subfamily
VADTPDAELVRRFLAGDVEAFTELVTRHERRVYGVCLRILGNAEDAADATQDTLVAVVRKLDGFRGDAAFTTWLHRVAMNVCYDHLRSAQRRPVLHRVLDDELPAQEEGPPVPDHADAVADAHVVAAALAEVPEDFRVAIVLADLQDLPYEEIAKILDLPLGTVKSRVHRGRVALGRALGLTDPIGEPEGTPRTSQERRS